LEKFDFAITHLLETEQSEVGTNIDEGRKSVQLCWTWKLSFLQESDLTEVVMQKNVVNTAFVEKNLKLNVEIVSAAEE